MDDKARFLRAYVDHSACKKNKEKLALWGRMLVIIQKMGFVTQSYSIHHAWRNSIDLSCFRSVHKRAVRQTDGRGIDRQPAVETARDSQWTLRKTRVSRLMDGQTDGQSVDETVIDSPWTDGQSTDRRTAGGQNDDRQSTEKQERTGGRTDRRNGDGQ